MTARKTAADRVLRARRETTAARQAADRFAANGADGLARQARADADRAAEAEKTAADAPRKSGVLGFGRNPGKGEYRRG
jgi:hypothetical protein